MASRSISFSTANPQISVETDDCDQINTVCGEQECLTRPKFFCGQLLTDQDLSALSEWAQNKHKLDRHKHGWGIVNGLQVRCDQTNRSQVVIDAGYAVDPCGNDIVVCDQSQFDFSAACPIEEKSCKEFVQQEEKPNPTFMGLELPAGAITVVDLLVHYHEVNELPLPALGRGACRERDACEYSRIQEHYRFEWCYANMGYSPFDDILARWEQGYFSECRALVDKFAAENPELTLGKLEEIKDWLFKRLDEHPLHEFCFIHEAIDQLSPEGDDKLEIEIARILFWMVQDCRNEYLQTRPLPIIENSGVPVARVWLHRENVSGASCKVIHVEDFPYPRRVWSRDDWPAPMGMTNLGGRIWQRAKQVCGILMDMGLKPLRRDLPVPQSIIELKDYLEKDNGKVANKLFWPLACHEPGSETSLEEIGVAVLVDGDNPLAERVFSFFGPSEKQFEGGMKEAIKERIVAQAKETSTNVSEASKAGRIEAKNTEAKLSTAEIASKEEEVDLLATINGIGEKRAFVLRQNGIGTFEELAAIDTKKLQAMFPKGVKDHEFSEWIKQAKRLAK